MTVDGMTTIYTYNTLDQLLSAETASFTYDARGNLVEVVDGLDTTTYAFDALDRMTGIILPDGASASYAYDSDGRRVQQSIDGAITNFLWDELSPYGDVVLETDGGGRMLASYVLGGPELISQTRAGATLYFLTDALSSVRALTDSSGAITDTYDYTAYGEIFARTGTTENPYLFAGQQFDSLTGQYYLRARYYHPELGRFLSRDPEQIDPYNPLELHRYVYSANNPVNLSDPSGRAVLTERAEIVSFDVIPVIRALTAVGAATACLYLRTVSYQMAVNKDRQGLLMLELSMPSPNPCHIPVLLYPAPATPVIAQHIQDSQNLHWPMLLTYLGPLNPQTKLNREAACPASRRAALRPLSCDEYPFATTAQGGASSSTRGVPPLEQSIQGGIVSAFYAIKLLGIPGTSFAVVVVPFQR